LNLIDIFKNNKGRVIHKWTHYFPIYEKLFQEYIGKYVLFLEIGVAEGGSLQMWKKYFGLNSKIIGIDKRKECYFKENQINIKIGNQSDKKFLQSIVDEFWRFDIILDDGSHHMRDMKASFEFLYPNLKTNGLYIIEDIEACYSSRRGGGLKHKNSFIEYAKNLIDELNAKSNELEETRFGYTTHSISFYDGIIVFKKGITKERKAIKTGV
jgi:hypothetical protein